MPHFNCLSCPTFLIFHEFIVLLFHSVKVRDLHKPNQSSIHINCAIYISHTHPYSLYTEPQTKNSYLTASHTAAFTYKQNINTPDHIMCMAILMQFISGQQKFKLDCHNIHQSVLQHGLAHLQSVDADGLQILSGC